MLHNKLSLFNLEFKLFIPKYLTSKMGVIGLWQLLQPTSRPTKLQALEGKKLAIDILLFMKI